MAIFKADNKNFALFSEEIEAIREDLSTYAEEKDLRDIENIKKNFELKTEDFFRENRKLNIGVVGQVKAGKSSFLNTLLFGGKEILPKASTPKTATLTKMEYSEENIIQIEYYSKEDWEVQLDNAAVNLEDEIYTSARELVEMVRRNNLDPEPYLEKGFDRIQFDTYDELISHLNDYVGEDGKFTPIVKAVTLYLNKEEFRGLSIVDTPGLNDPIASRTIRTKEFLEVCDVVFFLSQSGSFLDKSDWILLSSQLPQKGVKRMALIASKYDSGIRDVLRVPDEDDIFGDDDNTASNIGDAYKLIGKKLRKHAKRKVEEFVKDLEERQGSSELIEVIRQCSNPIMVSSLACNMVGKDASEYSPEEANVYHALQSFSSDMQADLALLGNFEPVKALFNEVISEKERILEQKSKAFIPNAQEELKNLLSGFKEKTEKRIQLLDKNDKEALVEQKNSVEAQMGSIKADIATVFGEFNAKIESEKAEGIRELRSSGKEYLSIKERTGSVTRRDSYTTGFFIFKKTHYYTYTEHYSYCIAADAIENLRKYALEASNHVEEVFTEALQIKEMKRKLLNVVVNNFDLGSEKYDSSLFRVMIEEMVSKIEFPVFTIDVSKEMAGITGKFNGELTSAGQKTELSTALSNAINRIYEEIIKQLTNEVRAFKEKMQKIGQDVQDNLLSDISAEFDSLLEKCENKQQEILKYQGYVEALQRNMDKLKQIF